MKKTFLYLILSLCLFSGVSYAQDRCVPEHSNHGRFERRGHRYRSPYFVAGNKVFFEGREMKDVSASSFVILRDGYAKDAWSVYYFGVKIKDASAGSFKVLGYGYAKDTWNVYFDGKKVNGATPGSFKVLSDGYAKDTWNVYYWGRKIAD